MSHIAASSFLCLLYIWTNLHFTLISLTYTTLPNPKNGATTPKATSTANHLLELPRIPPSARRHQLARLSRRPTNPALPARPARAHRANHPAGHLHHDAGAHRDENRAGVASRRGGRLRGRRVLGAARHRAPQPRCR